MFDERLMYEIEYQKMVALANQSSAFDELLQRFPEDDIEARNFARLAFSQTPNMIAVFHGFNPQNGEYEIRAHMPSILSREELGKLKTANPELFHRVNTLYLGFLKEKAGVAK